MSGGESAATFCNPFWRGSFPDPFVLKVRGRYYAYGTEQQERPEAGARIFPILTSSDLVHWQEAGRALQPLGTQYFRYWAPEVAAHNGKFLLYYAVHTDEFTAGIRVAAADAPDGPFVDSGHDLTGALSPWAIDPHVFCDHDGQWYLYMTVELRDDPSALTGVGNVVVRLRDPYTVEGSPSVVTPPRHAWQLFEDRRLERGGIDWYCVEGPTVLRHRRRYYEMFSGGCYYRDNYAVSYAVADTPMGPSSSRDTSWQEAMGPDGPRFLLQGRSGAISPGHNSVVYGPNNADFYLAYHTLSPERTERRPCLDRLFWHADEPWTAGSTDTQQPAPALPRWRDLYEHTQSTLSPSWTPDGGAWRAQDGIVVQDDRYARLALLHQQEVLGSAWLLEVNLRRLMGSGRYGLELRACDHALARITIEPTSELTVWSGESCVEQLSAAALPAGFAADDWHQLMCTFAGSVLGLQIDGRRLSEVVLAGSPRTIALLTEDCQAAFSGLSLTDHFRDEFLEDRHSLAALGWTNPPLHGAMERSAIDPAWHVKDGALVLDQSRHGCRVALKGPALQRFEGGATLRLNGEVAGGNPGLGLIAWHDSASALLLLITRDGQAWEMRALDHGPAPVTHAVHRLLSFDASAWHTLRLDYCAGQAVLYLDGKQVVSVPIAKKPARFGLVAQDVSAAFTSVWLTGVHTT